MAAHGDVAGLLRRRGYEQIKKIGEGSFGKAILVQNKEGSKLVCKMVDVSKASAKEQKDAMQEGKLLSGLKHPYIVRYRENFTEAGWFCILMDYCESGDLIKQVENARRSHKPISEEQILKWFTQAILALKYIHDKHILHRDLKPGNFFLSKNGSLKMGDFGIAKALSCTMAFARTQLGTPYYLSPEVCQQKPYAWPSDIWAMGCILYELCALKVPFDAANIQGLVQKITSSPMPAAPRGYSEFTCRLISEMMNRNPAKRPSTDDILKRPQIQAIVRQMLDDAQLNPEAGKADVGKGGYPKAAAVVVATPTPMQRRSPSAAALPPTPGGVVAGSPMRQRSESSPALPTGARGRSPSVNNTPRPPHGSPGSRANSPRPFPSRDHSPAPAARGGVQESPRLRPPGIPRIVDRSPLGRRNGAAEAVGAAIAGS
eukprot:TRINITY_DN16811_c0_g1_i1.p1 TRINITY_DN16811_c0_g1~~TRINITY_DN16811_c0_g1_i1.p1  ORF type:complete len:430 (+),score=69.57 TRINITY_DN16811_c0_g1_i1:50-1339(+)